MGIGQIVLLCVASYVVLRIGRRVAFGRSSSSIRPLTVLGVAAIIGGLAVFGGRHSPYAAKVRVDGSELEYKAAQQWTGWIDDEFATHERSSWKQFAHPEETTSDFASWLLISFGAAVLISASLFVCRGRARPVALKARS